MYAYAYKHMLQDTVSYKQVVKKKASCSMRCVWMGGGEGEGTNIDQDPYHKCDRALSNLFQQSRTVRIILTAFSY